MRTPRLNRKLALEARDRIPDGAGGFTEAWVEQGVLWAQITAGSGSERLGEEVRVAKTRFKIIVRAAPYGAPSRPRADQRFRDGIRIFKILSVAETDIGARYLACVAEEEVAS